MPPKKATKKTAEKKAQKIIEDKTFGLKNKNKSKKVQQYVKSVKAQVHGGSRGGGAGNPEKKGKGAKAKEDHELAMLFASVGGMEKKKKKKEKKEDEENKEPQEPELSPEEIAKLPLDEQIEYRRRRLRASGKPLTPVTPETFAKWYMEKKRQIEAETKKKNAAAAKKAGVKEWKSGRALYFENKELFKDDEGAYAADDVSNIADVPEEEEEETTGGGGGGAVDKKLFLEENDDDLDDIDDDDDEE